MQGRVASVEQASREPRPSTGGADHQSKNEEAFPNGQWSNGALNQGMANGAYGFNNMNAMNGMLPMDFNQIMASGMQMPMGAFPGMMGKLHHDDVPSRLTT